MRSFTLLAAVAAFLPAIFAQTTVPACVVDCIGQGSALTSCQSADSQCLCSSQTFIDGVNACLVQSCNADELTIGVGFGEQYCASVGVQVTIPSVLNEATSTAASSASATQAAEATTTVDTTSLSSAVSSAASSASQSVATSGTTGSPAASTPSPTSGASTLYFSSALGLVGAVGAAVLF
ncbi:hypothetical protein JCM16303_003351 [Sporobolomyces ruberrimus]